MTRYGQIVAAKRQRDLAEVRVDPRDQLIADLRARIARLERSEARLKYSNAELTKANHVLQDLAKGDL